MDVLCSSQDWMSYKRTRHIQHQSTWAVICPYFLSRGLKLLPKILITWSTHSQRKQGSKTLLYITSSSQDFSNTSLYVPKWTYSEKSCYTWSYSPAQCSTGYSSVAPTILLSLYPTLLHPPDKKEAYTCWIQRRNLVFT